MPSWFNPIGGLAATEGLRRHLAFRMALEQRNREEQHFQQQMDFTNQQAQLEQERFNKEYQQKSTELMRRNEELESEKRRWEEEKKLREKEFEEKVRQFNELLPIQKEEAAARTATAKASETRAGASVTRAEAYKSNLAAPKTAKGLQSEYIDTYNKAYNALMDQQKLRWADVAADPALHLKIIEAAKVAAAEAMRGNLAQFNEMSVTPENPMGTPLGVRDIMPNDDDLMKYGPPNLVEKEKAEFMKIDQSAEVGRRALEGKLTDREEALLKVFRPDRYEKYIDIKNERIRKEQAAAEAEKRLESQRKGRISILGSHP